MHEPTPTPINKLRLFKTFDQHNLYRYNVTYKLYPATYGDEEFILEIHFGNCSHWQFITRNEVAKVIFGEDD